MKKIIIYFSVLSSIFSLHHIQISAMKRYVTNPIAQKEPLQKKIKNAQCTQEEIVLAIPITEKEFLDAINATQTLKQEKLYPCNHPGCSFISAYSGNLTRHKKTHTRKKHLNDNPTQPKEPCS